MAWRAEAAAVWPFVERFFDGLVAAGVEAVCLSPGSRSTTSTGRCAPRGPTPTSALRRTAGCVSKTFSWGTGSSTPRSVSSRCDLRPWNHSRPSSSRCPTSPMRCHSALPGSRASSAIFASAVASGSSA